MTEIMGNLGSNTIHLEVRSGASLWSEVGLKWKGELDLTFDFRFSRRSHYRIAIDLSFRTLVSENRMDKGR